MKPLLCASLMLLSFSLVSGFAEDSNQKNTALPATQADASKSPSSDPFSGDGHTLFVEYDFLAKRSWADWGKLGKTGSNDESITSIITELKEHGWRLTHAAMDGTFNKAMLIFERD